MTSQRGQCHEVSLHGLRGGRAKPAIRARPLRDCRDFWPFPLGICSDASPPGVKAATCALICVPVQDVRDSTESLLHCGGSAVQGNAAHPRDYQSPLFLCLLHCLSTSAAQCKSALFSASTADIGHVPPSIFAVRRTGCHKAGNCRQRFLDFSWSWPKGSFAVCVRQRHRAAPLASTLAPAVCAIYFCGTPHCHSQADVNLLTAPTQWGPVGSLASSGPRMNRDTLARLWGSLSTNTPQLACQPLLCPRAAVLHSFLRQASLPDHGGTLCRRRDAVSGLPLSRQPIPLGQDVIYSALSVDPNAGRRVGEAKNPGPQTSLHSFFTAASAQQSSGPVHTVPAFPPDTSTVSFAVINPTAILGKEDLVASLQADVVFASETSAVAPVQHLSSAKFKQLVLPVFGGSQSPPILHLKLGLIPSVVMQLAWPSFLSFRSTGLQSR